MDPELVFIDALLDEQRKAERLFALISCVLFVLALLAFGLCLAASDKTFPALAGAAGSLIAAVPLKIVFAVRSQAVHYQFLKDAWQWAQTHSDPPQLDAYRAELAELRKSNLSRSWWA